MDCNIFMFMLLTVLLLFIGQSKAGFQWTAWSRPTPCSASCGEGVISRNRECKPSKKSDATDCKGPATIEEACMLSPCQYVDSGCNCGCQLTDPSGAISSMLPQNTNIQCNWFIKTRPGTSVTLTIHKVRNFDWSKGGIYIAGKDKVHKFTTQYGHRMVHTFPIVVRTKSNEFNMTMFYSNEYSKYHFINVEATYSTDDFSTGQKKNDSLYEKNFPAIIGISACVLIIVLAIIVLICRKIRSNNDENGDKTEEDYQEEAFEDNCSSISGSQRSTLKRNKQPLIPSMTGGQIYHVPACNYIPAQSTGEENASLLHMQMQDNSRQVPTYTSSENGNIPYMSSENGSIPAFVSNGNNMYIQAMPTSLPYTPVNLPYNNWSNQLPPSQQQQNNELLQVHQLPKAALDFMINQAQLNYVRQMSFDQSKPPSSYQPSENEG